VNFVKTPTAALLSRALSFALPFRGCRQLRSQRRRRRRQSLAHRVPKCECVCASTLNCKCQFDGHGEGEKELGRRGAEKRERGSTHTHTDVQCAISCLHSSPSLLVLVTRRLCRLILALSFARRFLHHWP